MWWRADFYIVDNQNGNGTVIHPSTSGTSMTVQVLSLTITNRTRPHLHTKYPRLEHGRRLERGRCSRVALSE